MAQSETVFTSALSPRYKVTVNWYAGNIYLHLQDYRKIRGEVQSRKITLNKEAIDVLFKIAPTIKQKIESFEKKNLVEDIPCTGIENSTDDEEPIVKPKKKKIKQKNEE